MKMSRLKIALGIPIVLLVSFVVWIVILPLHGRPDLSIKLLGYTNDTYGVRFAMIGITNRSDFPIIIYEPLMEIKTSTDPRGYTDYLSSGTNQWKRFHAQLARGMSANFAVPSPSGYTWRLAFYSYTDLGWPQIIKRIVNGGRLMPYDVESDWMNSGK